MSLRLAVVGPDGAGKTTMIEGTMSSMPVVHAMPRMRKFSTAKRGKGPGYQLAIEVMMSTERVWQSYKALVKGDVIMDRCYICALSYSRFWGGDRSVEYRIVKLFNRFIVKPNKIIFLWPSNGMAKPRKNYTQEEIQRLAGIYLDELIQGGWVEGKVDKYGLGRRSEWKRDTSSLWTRAKNLISRRK